MAIPSYRYPASLLAVWLPPRMARRKRHSRGPIKASRGPTRVPPAGIKSVRWLSGSANRVSRPARRLSGAARAGRARAGPAARARRSLAPGGGLAQRFAAANVTHDGRLTREQAQAGMPRVAENFDAIDVDQKGFVTLPEIRTFIAGSRPPAGSPASSNRTRIDSRPVRLTRQPPLGLIRPDFGRKPIHDMATKVKSQAQVQQRMGREHQDNRLCRHHCRRGANRCVSSRSTFPPAA